MCGLVSGLRIVLTTCPILQHRHTIIVKSRSCVPVTVEKGSLILCSIDGSTLLPLLNTSPTCCGRMLEFARTCMLYHLVFGSIEFLKYSTP